MEALSKTVYVVTMDVDPDWDDELNRWYREEHIPALMRVPGYLSVRRYRAVEGGPKYLALWEIDSIDNYRSEEHRQAVETPWTARIQPHRTSELGFYQQVFPDSGLQKGPADGQPEGGLMAIKLGPTPEGEADFNAWYDQEHLPALSAVPGVIACRRFKAIEGQADPPYLAIYHLVGPEVQASEPWKKAIDTPWSARVRTTFTKRWRAVYQPIS